MPDAVSIPDSDGDTLSESGHSSYSTAQSPLSDDTHLTSPEGSDDDASFDSGSEAESDSASEAGGAPAPAPEHDDAVVPSTYTGFIFGQGAVHQPIGHHITNAIAAASLAMNLALPLDDHNHHHHRQNPTHPAPIPYGTEADSVPSAAMPSATSAPDTDYTGADARDLPVRPPPVRANLAAADVPDDDAQQPPWTAGPLKCEFNPGCAYSFACTDGGRERWIEHHVVAHYLPRERALGAYVRPAEMGCWYCNNTFRCDDDPKKSALWHAVYKSRMQHMYHAHIRPHLRPAPDDPPAAQQGAEQLRLREYCRDFCVLKHAHAWGIIDEATYQQTLPQPRRVEHLPLSSVARTASTPEGRERARREHALPQQQAQALRGACVWNGPDVVRIRAGNRVREKRARREGKSEMSVEERVRAETMSGGAVGGMR
jgi:hypothetical protein